MNIKFYDVLAKIFILLAKSSNKRTIEIDFLKPGIQDSCKLLNIAIDEWEEIRTDLINTNLFSFVNGNLVFNKWKEMEKEIDTNIKNIWGNKFKNKNKVNDYWIKKTIENINIDINKDRETKIELSPHQVLVEYFKLLRGYDKLTEWDKINFKTYSNMSSRVIKTIGLEAGIKLVKWNQDKYGNQWYFGGILKSYPFYCQSLEIEKGENDRQNEAAQRY